MRRGLLHWIWSVVLCCWVLLIAGPAAHAQSTPTKRGQRDQPSFAGRDAAVVPTSALHFSNSVDAPIERSRQQPDRVRCGHRDALRYVAAWEACGHFARLGLPDGRDRSQKPYAVVSRGQPDDSWVREALQKVNWDQAVMIGVSDFVLKAFEQHASSGILSRTVPDSNRVPNWARWSQEDTPSQARLQLLAQQAVADAFVLAFNHAGHQLAVQSGQTAQYTSLSMLGTRRESFQATDGTGHADTYLEETLHRGICDALVRAANRIPDVPDTQQNTRFWQLVSRGIERATMMSLNRANVSNDDS